MKSSHLENFDKKFNHVREHLQAAVTRQRVHKNSNFSRLDAALSNDAELPESRLTSGWEQNSFVTPLDSRRDNM